MLGKLIKAVLVWFFFLRMCSMQGHLPEDVADLAKFVDGPGVVEEEAWWQVWRYQGLRL